MGWFRKFMSAVGLAGDSASVLKGGRTLMTREEKRELETLVREQLFRYHDANGTTSLLQADVYIVLDAEGPRIARELPDPQACLAFVLTQQLPSARALLAVAHEHIAVPRDAIKHLGTEATSALAQKINQLAGSNV